MFRFYSCVVDNLVAIKLKLLLCWCGFLSGSSPQFSGGSGLFQLCLAYFQCTSEDDRWIGFLQFQTSALGIFEGTFVFAFFGRQNGTALHNGGIWVQTNQCTFVDEWIKATHATEHFLVWCTQHRSDFFRFQQTSQIGVSHFRLWQIVALLQGRRIGP